MPKRNTLMPEEMISATFHERHGYLPDLKAPLSFSEKIQYRKLHDRDVRIQDLSDKISVKSYVTKRLGLDWVVPVLWSGPVLPPRHLRKWPRPYVLKANHGHGWNIFVWNEEENWDEIEPITQFWLSRTFGVELCEWGYSQIERQLLVEPFIGPNIQIPPIDFKFLVFGGRTQYIDVVVDRRVKPFRAAFYDRNWVKQSAHYIGDICPEPVPVPRSFDRMLWAADKIGEDFSFVRVDFYEINNLPAIGELTFYPASGYIPIHPVDFDRLLGSLWNYPTISL